MSTAVPTTIFDYTAEKCLISIHFSIDRSSPFFFFSACNFVVAVCIIHANTQHKQNHANVKKNVHEEIVHFDFYVGNFK